METKDLLRQLWEIQAKDADACSYQLQTDSGPTEYLVCPRAVLLDYAPVTTKESGKLYKVGDHPLKKLQDISKANPEIMLCEESLTIHKDEDIESYFLPLNNWSEVGMGVFDHIGDTVILKSILPYLKGGSFQFAGLTLHHVPDQVRWEIQRNGKFTDLNPRICKMRSGPVLVLLLSCDSALLVVTLSKNTNKCPLNEHIYMDRNRTELYRLDGLREDGVFFTRLVKGRQTLKGLANPTKRKAEEAPAEVVHVPEENPPIQDAPAVEEPQIEDVQPEQAAEIAEAAPVVEAPAEEPKKRTRTPRKQQVPKDYDGPFFGLNEKAIDDLIAYLGAPVPEQMSVESMQEEARKLRDLGVVLARRQSNLLMAASASEKKLKDVLRGVLGK